MNHSQLIDNLLNELSYRVGIVDLKNKNQQSIISEILSEWGELDAKKIIMEFLTEADKFTNPILNRKIKYVGKDGKEQEGLVGNLLTSPKDSPGRIEAEKLLPKPGTPQRDELEKEVGSQGGGGPQDDVSSGTTAQDDAEVKKNQQKTYGTDSYKAKLDKEKETANKLLDDEKDKSTPTEKESIISKADETILKRVQQQIEKNTVTFSDSDKQTTQDCYELTEKLFDESISDAEKISIAEELKTKYRITTNAGNTKYYINALGKNRKIFGNGTKSTERLVGQIKKYTQLEEVDYSGIKKKLTAAAKPDLGKEFEVKPDKDDNVKRMFESSPILSKIKKSQHGIFAPLDENGKALFPSNKHSKEYLKQSFENPALTKTIELAKEYVAQGHLTQEYVDALVNHQKRLSGILDNYEIPSEEAANAIGESYNELMIDLNEADSEAASAVMKQLAENRLYETSLALGEEVYLPSNGSFPGGDIIRIGSGEMDGKLERVSLVSCKFGKKGRTYGCPANMKAVTQLHRDENKRDLFGQYVGEAGFTMMIKDDLIEGKDSKETKENTSKLLKESLLNQGLSEVFSEDNIDTISEICTDYFYKLKNLRVKLKSKLGNVKAEVFWGEYQKELGKIKKEYQVKIQKVVGESELEKLFGKNNVPNFKTRLTPDVLLSGVLLTENIRTSGGYGLEHNKQYYTDEGEPMYKTEAGNDNPDDYSLTIRNERTAGRSGGGIQMSFTGDGARPNGELQS